MIFWYLTCTILWQSNLCLHHECRDNLVFPSSIKGFTEICSLSMTLLFSKNSNDLSCEVLTLARKLLKALATHLGWSISTSNLLGAELSILRKRQTTRSFHQQVDRLAITISTMTLVFLPLVEFSESRLSVRGRKRKNNNNNPQAEKGPTGETLRYFFLDCFSRLHT